jgi:UDP-glucose 4-epimerase
MTVLLTGGAGYIGSHIAAELLDGGHTVVIADNFCNSDISSIKALKQLPKINANNIKFSEIDVRNSEKLDEVFRQFNPNYVIHLAGFKAVGESVSDPLKYYGNNLSSAVTVLDVMLRHRVKNFVYSGSATVYNSDEPLPWSETTPCGVCSNPYGRTKYMIEHIIADVCSANPDFSAVTLRYFNPVGAHSSGLLEEQPRGIPNNLMPFIVKVARRELPKLNIFGNDYPTRDGTGVRDYLHVTDLAKGHIAALEFAGSRSGYEVFNLGTGRGISVLEIVRAFERVNGVKIPFEFAPRRDGDLAEFYADANKARRVLGWQAELGLDDMVKFNTNI